ncbi:MAG TPA: hypothetical protein VM432_08270 [Bdellovibrionales bacterium]|nr:hypothetical protein [Bdellovibrionales bacterium]
MKNATYWYGDFKCQAYCKTAGHGYEVGFYFGKNQIFVGNFIHKKEATKWWGIMNKELTKFTKRFAFSETASVTWYTKFFSHHLYKSYYSFLDTEFAKYQRTFNKAFKADARKYKTFSKKWDGAEFYSFRKAN